MLPREVDMVFDLTRLPEKQRFEQPRGLGNELYTNLPLFSCICKIPSTTSTYFKIISFTFIFKSCHLHLVDINNFASVPGI